MLPSQGTSKRGKTFKLNLLEKTELERFTTPQGRWYICPDGNNYLSVTSVISNSGFFNKTTLEEWKARVGEERANQVSTQARRRGSAVHELCERYVTNDANYAKGSMPVNLATFQKIREVLDAHVDDISGVEFPLWSAYWKTAGTADLLATWDGEPAIIDFKTSKKPIVEVEQKLLSYFVQATCYASMARAPTFNFNASKIVIIVAVDFEDPQVFIRGANEYRDFTKNVFFERFQTCEQLSMPFSS